MRRKIIWIIISALLVTTVVIAGSLQDSQTGFRNINRTTDVTADISGTANQIIITVNADGTIDISTPQDLHTGATPTWAAFNIHLPADDNITIDGSTNPRNMTLGAIRQTHTPVIPDTRAWHIEVDANSQPDTHAIFVAMSATGIVAGEDLQGIGMALDRANSTGGTMEALRVSDGGAGSAEAHALHTDPGVIVIHQETGSFGAVEQAWDENGGFTDVTAAFNDTGTDVTIFSANGDKIYIGDAADFNSIRINLDTVASGAGVKPDFEYSIAGPAWTAFVPNDATNGFRVSAQITWDETTFSSWAAVNINGATKKYIRITRTQVGLPTPPKEDTIQVLASVEYGWDEDGDVSLKDLTNSGIRISTPSSTQVIDAVGDVILANAQTVVLDPDADYVLTSTPHIADGTIGQILKITAGNGEANTVTLQDQDALGGSNIQLLSNVASRDITAQSVVLLWFDGTDWIEFGGGGAAAVAPTTHTLTLSGYTGAEAVDGNITGVSSSDPTITFIEAYISNDPTGDENINFTLGFYRTDTHDPEDLIVEYTFNITYTETNGGASATDTTDVVDTTGGLVKGDWILWQEDTEYSILTAVPTATGITFSPALADDKADDTGIARVTRIQNNFKYEDEDESDEIHIKGTTLSAPNASMNVFITIGVQ